MASPPSRTAASRCDTVDDYCGAYECTPKGEQLLDSVEPWLKAEVLEAAYRCLEEDSCYNIRSCISDWKYAVFDGSVLTDVILFNAD